MVRAREGPWMRTLRALALTVLIFAASARAAHWTPIGPWGGMVGGVAVDPTTPSTVYAVSTGGVFRSTDSGATWVSRNVGIRDIGYYDGFGHIAIDPQQPSTLYLVRGLGFPEPLLRSTDAGATWAPTTLVDLDNAHSVAVHPQAHDTIYVMDWQKVRVSTDAGTTWHTTTVLTSYENDVSLVLDPVDPEVAYLAANYDAPAFTEGGVYKTTDHGLTWQRVNTGLPTDDPVGLAIDPGPPSVLHLATTDGMFNSADGGATWTEALTPVPCVYYDGLRVDPAVANRLWAATCNGVFTSTDGGVTWAATGPGITMPSILAVGAGGGAVFAATEGHGLFRSIDGGATWTPQNQGLAAHGVTDFVTLPGGTSTIYAGTKRQGIQKTTDGGTTWARADAGITYAGTQTVGKIALDRQYPATLFATVDGNVWKTADGGASWAPSGSGLPSGKYVWAVAVDPTNSAVVYAGINDLTIGAPLVYKSTDGGASWLPTPLAATAALIKIDVIVVDPVTPSNVYAGGGRGATVARSTDGGASWTPVSVSFPGFDAGSLLIDPQHPSTLYAGTYQDGLHRSLDAGLSWTRLNAFTNYGVSGLALDPATPAHVFASFESGLVASLDAGASFSDVTGDIKAGMPYPLVSAMAVDPTNPIRLLAATDGGGIYAGLLTPCAVAADCTLVRDLCQVPTCAPANPNADAFGCLRTATECPGDECHAGGTCNPDTGACVPEQVPDGSPCARPPGCTVDTCYGGVCRHDFVPQNNCFHPIARGGATLTVRDATSAKASLNWKWGKGDAFDPAYVGNPFIAFRDTYRLCVADLGGPAGAFRLLLDAALPSGGTCGKRPCWSAAGVDVKYQDRDLAADGIRSLRFHPGVAGKAKVTVSAKGANLPLVAAPPYANAVVVELRRDDTPVCWQSTFDQLIRRNQTGLFTAKSGTD